VYNAGLHISQFWDGRSPDVEDQAKGPILNPIEMAMPSQSAVIERLRMDPEYVELFALTFPAEENPITYDNLARAIGAFERRLMTPAPLDAFMAGDDTALSPAQLAGLNDFMSLGCVTCHNGPAVGGAMYQKLGLVHPYATEDLGRYQITSQTSDRYVFKVPSLRNIAKTGPYFHDGSIGSLSEAIRLMGYHQLGVDLEAEQIASIMAFFEALTGEIDVEYVRQR
jgi:cytochrome c peroxidase